MKKLLIIAGVIVASGSSFAQEKTPPSPELRALNERLGREINVSLQCSTYNYTLEDRVKAAEAEVKRLTDKYEPKADPAK